MRLDAREIHRRVKVFPEACRRYGIKPTHQRVEIYRELAGTDEHPDAERVYLRVRKRIPAISLDTVYRTLRLLENKGFISRVGSLGEKTRFDANTDRHHHYICTTCGFIGDICNKAWDNFRAPEETKVMGTVNSVHVELRGLCRTCRGK